MPLKKGSDKEKETKTLCKLLMLNSWREALPSFNGKVQWILKNPRDPKYLKPPEIWYSRIRRSCEIFSINSMIEGAFLGLGYL